MMPTPTPPLSSLPSPRSLECSLMLQLPTLTLPHPIPSATKHPSVLPREVAARALHKPFQKHPLFRHRQPPHTRFPTLRCRIHSTHKLPHQATKSFRRSFNSTSKEQLIPAPLLLFRLLMMISLQPKQASITSFTTIHNHPPIPGSMAFLASKTFVSSTLTGTPLPSIPHWEYLASQLLSMAFQKLTIFLFFYFFFKV